MVDIVVPMVKQDSKILPPVGRDVVGWWVVVVSLVVGGRVVVGG